MNQQDNFENEGSSELLADLPLTDEQAEATKGGPGITPLRHGGPADLNLYIADIGDN